MYSFRLIFFHRKRHLHISLSLKSPFKRKLQIHACFQSLRKPEILFFHTIATEFCNTDSRPKKRPHRYFLLYHIKQNQHFHNSSVQLDYYLSTLVFLSVLHILLCAEQPRLIELSQSHLHLYFALIL